MPPTFGPEILAELAQLKTQLAEVKAENARLRAVIERGGPVLVPLEPETREGA